MRLFIARIRLRPQLASLLRLFQVSRYLCIVIRRDEVPLLFTGAIAQRIGLLHALRGQGELSHRAVREGQVRIGQGEVGVDFQGALEERHAGDLTAGIAYA